MPTPPVGLPPYPTLFTFDIFGTVLDWRRGTEEACRAAGRPLREGEFDRIVDAQGRLERQEPGRRYASIVAASLVEVLGLPGEAARRIGETAGTWPLFPDSREGIAALIRRAPGVAMTNSDRTHGGQILDQLGFPLSLWICAEDTGVYKPSPGFWSRVAAVLGRSPGPDWWHVSAYGDYDLEVARQLGLTCVFVARPHARPGPHDLAVPDLVALGGALARLYPGPAAAGAGS